MKTERAIRRSFHELLLEKDIKRITVRELAERAEINKTTFYAHYETLPNLIDTLEQENIAYIIEHLDRVPLLFEDPDLFIDNLYFNLMDCNVAALSRNGSFNQQFLRRLQAAIRNDIDTRNIDVSNYRDISTLLIFILHGVIGIVNTEGHRAEDLQPIKQFVKKGLPDSL